MKSFVDFLRNKKEADDWKPINQVSPPSLRAFSAAGGISSLGKELNLLSKGLLAFSIVAASSFFVIAIYVKQGESRFEADRIEFQRRAKEEQRKAQMEAERVREEEERKQALVAASVDKLSAGFQRYQLDREIDQKGSALVRQRLIIDREQLKKAQEFRDKERAAIARKIKEELDAKVKLKEDEDCIKAQNKYLATRETLSIDGLINARNDISSLCK